MAIPVDGKLGNSIIQAYEWRLPVINQRNPNLEAACADWPEAECRFRSGMNASANN